MNNKYTIEKEFIRRTGRIITTGFKYIGEDAQNPDGFAKRLLLAELYLNGKISTEIHKRFDIAMRFHL